MRQEMRDEMMTKPRTPTGIALLGRINLVIYILLLFWALSLVLFTASLIAVGLVLYPAAGITCSFGLLRQKKYGWYTAMIMWPAEGVVSSWVTYVSTGFSPLDIGTTIMFMLIALFKFATTGYLARNKIRQWFDIHNGGHATVTDERTDSPLVKNKEEQTTHNQ